MSETTLAIRQTLFKVSIGFAFLSVLISCNKNNTVCCRRHASLYGFGASPMEKRVPAQDQPRRARKHYERGSQTNSSQNHDGQCDPGAFGAIMLSNGTGADVMKRIAAPMVGGEITSTILELIICPAIYWIWRSPISGTVEIRGNSMQCASVVYLRRKEPPDEWR